MNNILLGSAIGDSLGMPFESKPADNPLLLNWDGKTFLGSEYHKLTPGQFTDDTQFSCTLAQSLVDCNGFDPDDISKRYVQLFTSQTIRGYGRTTLMAIQNLQAGKHWSKSGIPQSYGNGTAMRVAPLGVYCRHDLHSLISFVRIDSAITHASDEAEAGALAIALAIFYILNFDEEDLIFKIAENLPNSKVKEKILQIPDFINSVIEPSIVLQFFGTRADVRQTVPSSLYCFLKFKNYPDAVIAAIRGGGDTDTNASIVGALCAAKYPNNTIPQEWINQIEDRNKLIALNKQLFLIR